MSFEPEGPTSGETPRFPGLRLALTCLGFGLMTFGLNLLPHDPTEELPAIAMPPEPLVHGLSLEPGTGEFRVFVVGASLTAGYPYQPFGSVSYGKLLGKGLARALPARRIVSEPVAKPALDSPKLARIVDRLLAYKPGLLCVALGSNEFANRIVFDRFLVPRDPGSWLEDRLGRARRLFRLLPGQHASGRGEEAEESFRKQLLSKGRESRWGVPVFGGLPVPEDEQEMLIQRMQSAMVRIHASARRAGVPLVFLVAVYGLGGSWPWGISRGGLIHEIDSLVMSSWKGIDETTLTRIESLLPAHPERADLHFLEGLALRRLGRAPEAKRAFEKARDLDEVPMHLTGAIRRSILEQAKALGRACILLDDALIADSKDGIQGPEHYLDYGHLDVEGHVLVARYLAERLHDLGLLPAELPEGWRSSFTLGMREHLRAVAATPLGKESLLLAQAKMATADGVFSMLFGNFREALPYLKRGFSQMPYSPDLAIMLTICTYSLAGRLDELRGSGPIEANRTFVTTQRRLISSVAEARLDEAIDAILHGK
ncbi:MAG: hypothetical protein ACE5F1_11960 [Planctomycetota bacterium]